MVFYERRVDTVGGYLSEGSPHLNSPSLILMKKGDIEGIHDQQTCSSRNVLKKKVLQNCYY